MALSCYRMKYFLQYMHTTKEINTNENFCCVAILLNIRSQCTDTVQGSGVVEGLGKSHGGGHGKHSIWGRGCVACINWPSNQSKVPVRSNVERQHERHGGRSSVGVDNLVGQ